LVTAQTSAAAIMNKMGLNAETGLIVMADLPVTFIEP
jgi:hypothetical protein